MEFYTVFGLLEHSEENAQQRFYKLATLICGLLVVLGSSAPLTTGAAHAAERSKPVVLTAMQATFAVSSLLTENTDITVVNIPEKGRRIFGLQRYLHKFSKKLAPVLAKADAVVSINKLWPEDPLYTAARSENVRVVNIDATRPWSSSMTGVSVVDEPQMSGAWVNGAGKPLTVRRSSLYFWHSLANVTRMSELIAADLVQLYPAEEKQLRSNLATLQARIHSLRLRYEKAYTAIENLSVFALCSEFVYLTDDTGIFVDGYFIKQDIAWTPEDLAALTDRLKQNDIPVVIHKWMPTEAIQQAVADGGAKLVVLDALDGGDASRKKLTPEMFFTTLANNLALLQKGFEGS